MATALQASTTFAAPAKEQQAQEAYARALKVYEVDEQASVNLFTKAAKLGNSDAMVRLGYIFQTGSNPRYKEAIQWYKKAVNAGNTAVMYEIGSLYEEGSRNTKPDYTEAIHWYEMGVSNNSLKSCAALANIYASCPMPAYHDGATAVEYATILVKKDPRNGEYLDLLAAACVRNHDFPSALRAASAAITASSLDEAAARRARKENYEAGKPHLETASAEWILTEAEKENMWAMLKLAKRHNNRFGEMYNPANARYWFEKAAQNGSPLALVQLGHMCFLGEGGEVNHDKAFWCFSEAAKMEYAPAYAPLARMYLGGKGTKADAEDALLWYSKAKDAGGQVNGVNFSAVKTYVGGKEKPTPEQMVAKARAIAKNGDKGKELNPAQKTSQIYSRYWLAAEMGNTDAMKELADMYFYGRRYFKRDASPEDKKTGGLNLNYPKALEWYELLSRKGIEAPELAECRELALQQMREMHERDQRKKRDAKFAGNHSKNKKG